MSSIRCFLKSLSLGLLGISLALGQAETKTRLRVTEQLTPPQKTSCASLVSEREGDLCYDRTLHSLKVYSGSSWVDASVPGCSSDPPTGACDNGRLCLDDTNGVLYGCISATWTTLVRTSDLQGAGTAGTLAYWSTTSNLAAWSGHLLLEESYDDTTTESVAWSGIAIGANEGTYDGTVSLVILTNPPASGSETQAPFGQSTTGGLVIPVGDDYGGSTMGAIVYDFGKDIGDGKGIPTSGYFIDKWGGEASPGYATWPIWCKEVYYNAWGAWDSAADIDQVSGASEMSHSCGSDYVIHHKPLFGKCASCSGTIGSAFFNLGFIDAARSTPADASKDIQFGFSYGPSGGSCGSGTGQSVKISATYGSGNTRPLKSEVVCLEDILEDVPGVSKSIYGNWTFDKATTYADGSAYSGGDPTQVNFNYGAAFSSLGNELYGNLFRPPIRVDLRGYGTGFIARISMGDQQGGISGYDSDADSTPDELEGDIQAIKESYAGAGYFNGVRLKLIAGASEDPEGGDGVFQNRRVGSLILDGWEDADSDSTVEATEYGKLANSLGPLQNTAPAYYGRLQQDIDGTAGSEVSIYPRTLGGVTTYHFDLNNDNTANVADLCLRNEGLDLNCDGTADTSVDSATVVDNGVGSSKATATVTPLTRLYTITCNDADGCTITLGETNVPAGFVTSIFCLSANNCEIDEAANITNLSADPVVLADPYDSITLVYLTDIWVQIATADVNP